MNKDVLETMSTERDLEGLPSLIDWIDVTPDRRRQRNCAGTRTAKQRGDTSQSREEMQTIKPLDAAVAVNEAQADIKAEFGEVLQAASGRQLSKTPNLTKGSKDGMCSPAVEATGNGEGENYHITRAWKKAVVWLE